MDIFDEKYWDKKVADVHWYLEIPGLISRLSRLHDEDRAAFESVKERIYGFFERKLELDQIALGDTGKEHDAERKPIDTVVIHHTSMKPGLSKERLSAIDLVRLYAVQYASPAYDAERKTRKVPIYSGHFRNGVQVFWPYHWMVRTDGSVERLLLDEEIGWHAGNWDVNCKSIAIVLDNDYEDSWPSDREMQCIGGLIREHYPHVTRDNVFGHCEINPKTSCPSRQFLPEDEIEAGWKEKLLSFMPSEHLL